MQKVKTVNYAKDGADLMIAFENIMKLIESRGIDRPLYHLVLLRASQINRCSFCVKMHTREAREDGETDKRLDHLIVWNHSEDYSEKEKAAIAWTEALTLNENHDAIANLRADLMTHFSDEEIATLTATIAMINVWNRIQVSNY